MRTTSGLIDFDGFAEPGRQRHRMNPEISSDLCQCHTRVTMPGNPDNVISKLLRIGFAMRQSSQSKLTPPTAAVPLYP